MERKGATGLRVLAGLTGLLVTWVSSMAPGAQAAEPPRIRCLQSYGHEVPPPCEPNPDQLTAIDYEGKVYPNSKPYPTHQGITPPTGNMFVEGNATPGSIVTFTIEDDVTTIGPFQVQASSTGAFSAEVNVVALGGHRATPEADADSVGDDELGPTELTIRASVRNANGSTGGYTDTIVKHAATAGDVKAPEISDQQWPPQDLDHGCNSRYTARYWNDLNDGLGIPGIRFTGYSQCPWYPIAGTLKDFDGATVSEISDVRITVSKGNRTYIDVRHSQDSALLPPGRGEILTRISADMSRYWYLMNVRDLPPNSGALVGLDDWYTITVTACDAWGDVTVPNSNCSTTSLGEIAVYPF